MSNQGNIKMLDKNCLRNSKDQVKKLIQLLDMIASTNINLEAKNDKIRSEQNL